jgi:hypothetical protein
MRYILKYIMNYMDIVEHMGNNVNILRDNPII